MTRELLIVASGAVAGLVIGYVINIWRATSRYIKRLDAAKKYERDNGIWWR